MSTRFVFAVMLSFAIQAGSAAAAEGTPGAAGKSAAELQEWCKANPEKCREMQAKRKERQEACKADPEKCRAEAQAKRDERFTRADANKDGKLTRQEAEQGIPGVAARFDQIDTNKDGTISKEELAAAGKARAEQRKDGQKP